MRDLAASVTGCAVATAFGTSVAGNVEALFRGECAFSAPRHFDAKGRQLGIDHELDAGAGSRAERLLEKLRAGMDFKIPAGTSLFVATTVGAIDRLERGEELDTSLEFLHLAERIFGVKNGILVSAACASGQCAAGLVQTYFMISTYVSVLCFCCLVVASFSPMYIFVSIIIISY